MNLEKFKKINEDQLKQISGGFWQILAMIFPFALQALSQSVASFKAISSDNGSIKSKDYETKWETSAPSSTKIADTSVKQIVYAY